MKDNDGGIAIGFAIGMLLSLVLCIAWAYDANRASVIKACGKCEVPGKLCGEFVCTKDGWD